MSDKINTKDTTNDFQWRQFCRLGEMIGDGLHLEPDGKWISREYKKLQKILLPDTPEMKEFKRKRRQAKNESINNQIAERLKKDKCRCGGALKQTRSGSKTVICTVSGCGKRYTYKSKKR